MGWFVSTLNPKPLNPNLADHDFRISRDDLLRYGNHSLTYRIVDRIFAQVGWQTLRIRQP